MATGKLIFASDPQKKDFIFKQDVETTINDVITKKMTTIATWVITVLLSIVFGGIIASLWDLNGKIHNVIGQEAVRSEIEKIYANKISLLEKENDLLKIEIANYNKTSILPKGGVK